MQIIRPTFTLTHDDITYTTSVINPKTLRDGDPEPLADEDTYTSQIAESNYTWTGKWGDTEEESYMGCEVGFHLWAELRIYSSNEMTITAIISNKTYYNPYTGLEGRPQLGPLYGFGFINVGGIAFGESPIQRTTSSCDWYLGREPEVWADVRDNEILKAVDAENIVTSFWGNDDEAAESEGRYGYYEPGNETHVWNLTSYEQVKNVIIILPFERYADWGEMNDDGTYQIGTAVTEEAGSFYLNFEELYPYYYPGARRINSAWTSLNSSGHYVKRRKSGSWSDVKDTQYSTDDQAWRRVSNTWQDIKLYE